MHCTNSQAFEKGMVISMGMERKQGENPWKDISLSDYENHMALESVQQLQALNKIMKEQFYTYDIDSIMILGVAGGNGLEHIDCKKIEKVYGVDINQDYLQECKKRYAKLGDVLETICMDLMQDEIQLPYVELVVANLLIEYIGYECFQKVIRAIKPKIVSCVIQINEDDTFVSESPYLHAFDGLEEIHHQMEYYYLINAMERTGLHKLLEAEYDLPNGKKFLRVDFGTLI